jgi:lysophospholipid acyltransferase (LPLAT)-like uncharacterized protein
MGEIPEWQRSWWKRLQIAVIAGLATPLIRVLAWTWRWRVEGESLLAGVEAGGGHAIHAFWHGRILPATVHFRNRGIVVITSQNFDGEWIARIIGRFGYGTARGSTSRGGPAALRQMIRDVRSNGVAFTLDGPRGPARVAQPGAIWLSKASGEPIVPFHLEARAFWSLRSWDRTQIPKPFTTVALVFGAPLQVPRDATDAALEQWRTKLEETLAACETRCVTITQSTDRSSNH